MDKTWIPIYSADKNYLAELAKQVLNDHGIPAFLVNKKDSNYLFGFIEVYIKPQDAIRAKHALKNLEL